MANKVPIIAWSERPDASAATARAIAAS